MRTPMGIGRAESAIRCCPGEPASDAGGLTGVLDVDTGLLRQHRPGSASEGSQQTHGLPVGAALHRALAESTGTDGGW